MHIDSTYCHQAAIATIQDTEDRDNSALAYWLGPVEPKHAWLDERYDDLAFEQEQRREFEDIQAGR